MAAEGCGTRPSPPLLWVNYIWVQLWLSSTAGTRTETPDASLKVAVLFKKLPRTGSPSQMTPRFLFLGGFRFLVYQERETVLPRACPGVKQLQEGAGLGGATPCRQCIQGRSSHVMSPMLVYTPHPSKKRKNPVANLSFSLLGVAVTSAPQLEPRSAGPSHSPV